MTALIGALVQSAEYVERNKCAGSRFLSPGLAKSMGGRVISSKRSLKIDRLTVGTRILVV
jgi:hypothetical protein